MLTSHAQNLEDVILWRALKHVERGFYIDIGAQDPVIDSVSLAFYEKGWRGVHVEPSSFYANLLRSARPDEEVLQVAIGPREQSIEFFEFPNTGLSTGDVNIAQETSQKGFSFVPVQVPCLRLSELLDSYRDRDIHWMKIDVEGMERLVIESWLPSTVRPQIVVIESTVPMSSTPSHEAWEHQLLALHYSYVFFDGVNRYYVNDQHAELKEDFGLRLGFFDEIALSGAANSPIYSTTKAERINLEARLKASEEERLARTEQLVELQKVNSSLKNQLAAAIGENKPAYEQEIAALQQQVLFLETDFWGAISRASKKTLERWTDRHESGSYATKSRPKSYRKFIESRLLLLFIPFFSNSLAARVKRRMEKHRHTAETKGGHR